MNMLRADSIPKPSANLSLGFERFGTKPLKAFTYGSAEARTPGAKSGA